MPQQQLQHQQWQHSHSHLVSQSQLSTARSLSHVLRAHFDGSNGGSGPGDEKVSRSHCAALVMHAWILGHPLCSSIHASEPCLISFIPCKANMRFHTAAPNNCSCGCLHTNTPTAHAGCMHNCWDGFISWPMFFRNKRCIAPMRVSNIKSYQPCDPILFPMYDTMFRSLLSSGMCLPCRLLHVLQPALCKLLLRKRQRHTPFALL